MVTNRWNYDELEARVMRENGLFRDHLERVRLRLLRDEPAMKAMLLWVTAGHNPSSEEFVRLCAAGVVKGTSPVNLSFRCGLYEYYLKAALA